MPMDEPARAGFTKSGQPCSAAKSTIFLRAAAPLPHGAVVGDLLPLAGPDHQIRADGQPEGGEHPLHVLLVLPDGRGEDARADVRDTGELQQTLEGAVLAVRAVQYGEDDIDLAQRLGHGARLAVDDLAVARIHGEDDAAVRGLGDLLDARQGPVGDGHPVRIVGGERPAAVGGDADGQDVVLRTVDGPQYGTRRDHRNGVLGAPAAEDDGHARLAELLLRALGGVLAAHIAMSVPVGSRRVSGARAWRCVTSAP